MYRILDKTKYLVKKCAFVALFCAFLISINFVSTALNPGIKQYEHLNELVAFDDESGIGKYFDVEINDRTFKFMTLFLNDRDYEYSYSLYLMQEIDNDFIDVGILSSDDYIVVAYNKRVGILEKERISIQNKATQGLLSISAADILERSVNLSCDAIGKKKYIEPSRFDVVKGQSGIEYYKESPYIMYKRLENNKYLRLSIESLLEEFASKTEIENGINIYEYENMKYIIDDSGIAMFAFDKPISIKALINKKEKSADDYYDIAVASEEGRGTRINYNLALTCYEKACELGNADALYKLGRMYHFGRGLNKDYEVARECYEKAAKLGNDMAMYNLGVLYENGLGVMQDYKKAKEYYEMAAEKNNMYAFHNLGMIYNDGKGVDVDYNMAVKYFKLAADAGSGYSYSCLGLIYERGLLGEYNYEYARECYEEGIKLGSSDAMCNLGLMYCVGSFTNVPNLSLGREYLEKAAKMGNERAIRMLIEINSGKFDSLENDNK